MSYQRVVDDAIRHRDRIRELAHRLTDSTIEDFVRRGQHRPGGDGFPPGGGSEVHGGAASTTTEAAALCLAVAADSGEPDTWESWELDLVAEALGDAFAHLAEMAGIARSVTRKLDFVVSVYARTDRLKGGAGDCAACTRLVTGAPDDRLRAGYCAACYMAWIRAGHPDRVAFEHTREASSKRRSA